ncbi:MAG: formyl transferase [Bacteroidetes bacterium]|nr:formyl transferase [Bacteroidota bacterium]
MQASPIKIVFLVSGEGGSLKFIHEYLAANKLNFIISGVIADRDCAALHYAQNKNIPACNLKYSSKIKESSIALIEKLKAFEPDIIVTNIHKVIDSETLNSFPGKFINLHYSLLPAFAGLIGMATVEEAKKSNVGFIGATCHWVNEQLDGGTIICQSSFPVNWNQPMSQIIETVFQSACFILLNSIIQKFTDNWNEGTKTLQIHSNTVTFNPPLQFNGNNAFKIFPLLK